MEPVSWRTATLAALVSSSVIFGLFQLYTWALPL